MQITTDTTVIHGLIQAEFDKRWLQLINSAQNLPFGGVNVIRISDVSNLIYKNFAHSVVTELKNQESKVVD